jgi:hypothetical protein
MSRKSTYALRVFICATALTACASYRDVTSAQIAPRTELSVRFFAPRPVTFMSADGIELAIDDVIELHGRMISRHADSIRIGAISARRVGGVQRFGAGTTATFAPADVRMQQIRRHTGRTIALLAVLAIAVVVVVAAATVEPAPPPPSEPKSKEA